MAVNQTTSRFLNLTYRFRKNGHGFRKISKNITPILKDFEWILKKKTAAASSRQNDNGCNEALMIGYMERDRFFKSPAYNIFTAQIKNQNNDIMSLAPANKEILDKAVKAIHERVFYAQYPSTPKPMVRMHPTWA